MVKDKSLFYTQCILIGRYGMESNQSSTLLGRVRKVIRYKHYSIRAERTYVEWVRRFVAFHGRCHPREMGADEVRVFLGYLAAELKVAASTHQQALSARLLYGTGMRLMECLRLRAKDGDFERGELTGRHGKGGKYRLPVFAGIPRSTAKIVAFLVGGS